MATPTVGSPGDNKAFLDGAAVTLPVTIDATHNQFEFNEREYKIAQRGSFIVSTTAIAPTRTTGPTKRVGYVIDATHNQFEFNELEYIIPSGTYKTLSKLAQAMNGALETANGNGRFDVIAQVSAPDNEHLRIDTVANISLVTLGTGAANDCLGRLGFADLDAVAPDSYKHLKSLCNAINNAVDTGDASLFSAVATASPSPFTDGAIRVTAVAAGVNTKAWGTGAVNDCVTLLGFADLQTLAGGA